jgi:plasmid replication initiation protein
MIENKQDDLVVQHNNLVNSRFEMTIYEMRMFLFMLSAINQDDDEFNAVKIPVSYFKSLSSDVKSNFYKIIKETAQSLHKKEITIESTVTTSKGRKRRKFHTYSLMAESSYIEGAAYVQAEFNDKLAPYLLELKNNFTTAQLRQLLKFKSYYTHRIYWLLKQYSNFKQKQAADGTMERRVELDELRALVGAEDKYDRYDHFRKYVIHKAQQEMKHSDLPFTFTEERIGRIVNAIIFRFKPHIGKESKKLSPREKVALEQVNTSPAQQGKTRDMSVLGNSKDSPSPTPLKERNVGQKIDVFSRLLRFGLSDYQARRFSDHYPEKELHKLCYHFEIEFASNQTPDIKKPAHVYMSLCKHYNLKP